LSAAEMPASTKIALNTDEATSTTVPCDINRSCQLSTYTTVTLKYKKTSLHVPLSVQTASEASQQIVPPASRRKPPRLRKLHVEATPRLATSPQATPRAPLSPRWLQATQSTVIFSSERVACECSSRRVRTQPR
jgi:hypothetical protein